ncbi:MAG: hypothetical protein LBR23_04800 [Spirochaetaceae bacterium]|jgi:hypothetical protein|nr:hypothetical protein [Spirochaetaceae bacterium]
MDGVDARAEKTRAVAALLFPGEEWGQTEARIWVAASRLSERDKEPDKWEKEMAQVRILTSRGSVAYFLPEREMGENERRCADIVLNGVVTEMKTTAGTRTTVGGEFRLAFKQGADLLRDQPDRREHSVFIRLLSDLSVGSIKAKIAGELKERHDDGIFFCFFEKIGVLYSWTYEELRALIGR